MSITTKRIVGKKTLYLVNWKDRYDLDMTDDFDSIRVKWIAWKTDTVDLGSLALNILNLDTNIGTLKLPDGTERSYTSIMYLHPLNNATVYSEDLIEPPIQLGRTKHNYNNFDYEIYIDGASGYAGISVSNPVFLEITFYKG